MKLMQTIRRLLTVIPIVVVPAAATAQTAVRFGNESADTTAITNMLVEGAAAHLTSPEEYVAFFGNKFAGTPYGAHTLEGDTEILTVRLDSIDCTTFVETALALAYTVGENRTSWRDFIYNLQRLRYRGGTVDGYASRLHYIADWAVDNIHRGNLTDATRLFPKVNYIVRTIDFMSANADRYPALSDSATLARIRSIEEGYRSHRFPYLKTSDLGSRAMTDALRNGDVVAFVSNLNNLDVTHMGIIVKESPTAVPHVMHASSSQGKVVVESRPLVDFLRKNRYWLGIRVFRLAR
ncbi:MAG: DUF1460 domain-containing protein [Muribaculaceae bacterium]|nr:DUF1460 domain-containing protein [Muribaculaceae bacterium]